MQRQPVTSSAIASVGYDRSRRTLEVEFVSGSVYQYAGVPPTVHEEFLAASSLGHYFGTDIRDATPIRTFASECQRRSAPTRRAMPG